jgi:hypothetical protein
MNSPEVVAIGDVHSCASLLEQELRPHLDSGAELIVLGDLIDRSPEADGDRRVLERVWQLQENPAAYGLAPSAPGLVQRCRTDASRPEARPSPCMAIGTGSRGG